MNFPILRNRDCRSRDSPRQTKGKIRPLKLEGGEERGIKRKEESKKEGKQEGMQERRKEGKKERRKKGRKEGREEKYLSNRRKTDC